VTGVRLRTGGRGLNQRPTVKVRCSPTGANGPPQRAIIAGSPRLGKIAGAPARRWSVASRVRIQKVKRCPLGDYGRPDAFAAIAAAALLRSRSSSGNGVDGWRCGRFRSRARRQSSAASVSPLAICGLPRHTTTCTFAEGMRPFASPTINDHHGFRLALIIGRANQPSSDGRACR
jgi:hypothetical protein